MKNIVNPTNGTWKRTQFSTLTLRCPNDSPCSWTPPLEGDAGADFSLRCDGQGRNIQPNPVCSLCEHGFGSDGRSCGRCQGNADFAVVFVALLALIILILYFSEKYKVFTEERLDRGTTMKIVLSYTHLLVAAARLKDRFEGVLFDWLDVETKGGQAVASFNLPQVDCLLKSGGMGYHAQFYIKMTLPLILAVCLASIVTAMILVRGKRGQKSRDIVLDAIIRTTTVMLNLLYPWISEQVFGVISSARLDRAIRITGGNLAYEELQADYLAASTNFSVEYTSRSHSFAVVVAVIACIIFVISMPACLALYLRTKRAQLATPMFQARLGFTYLGYREMFFFWESIVIARKAAVAFVVTALSTDEASREYQVGFSTLVVVVAFAAHTFCMPFKKASHNIMELMSIGSSCSVMFASIMYLSGAIMNQPILEAITAAIVISVNLTFITSAIYQLSSSYVKMLMGTKVAKSIFRL